MRKKLLKNVYLKKTYLTFINSFKKIDKKIIYTVFFDLLLFLFLIGSLFLWNALISKQVELIPPELLQNPENLSPEKAQETALLMKDYLISIAVYTLSLLVFIFLIWALFKGIIWNIVLEKKFSLRYYGKFLLLNLLWLVIWLIPLILIAISLKTKAFLILLLIVLALFVYLTAILYILFTKDLTAKKTERKTKKFSLTDKKFYVLSTIKDTFKTGFGKIKFFILPYVLIILTMLAISLVLWPTHFLPEKIYTSISTLILVFYIAWTRFYLADVVKEISK